MKGPTNLMVFNLCMKRFLCLCVWYLGSNDALGSNCSKSTNPSSGSTVSIHSRQTLSAQDDTNMLATDPLKCIFLYEQI